MEHINFELINMFFTLSKTLAFLTSPITWIIILMVFAVFLKNRRKGKFFMFAALLLFYFFSNAFIATEMMRLWEVPITDDKDLDKHYDLGVVLGGGMITEDKEYNRLAFRTNVDRIMQGVVLYKSGTIDKLLISGGAASLLYPDMLESALLKKYLVRIGIPSKDIIIDSTSDNTHENAVNTVKIIRKQYQVTHILLITSGFHMRRALACFKKEGINPYTYSTDKIAGKRRYQFGYLFLPKLESFKTWDKLIHEWIGFMVYRIMGYV